LTFTLPNLESVPTVFRWDHGGRNVYITGTFNNWEKQVIFEITYDDIVLFLMV
jgi:polyisoprenoid-binding protein YceI